MPQGSKSDPLPEQTNCYKLPSCLSLTTHLTRFCFAGSPVSDARCMQSLVEEGSRVRWLQFFADFGNGREPWR